MRKPRYTAEEIDFIVQTAHMLSGDAYKKYCDIFGPVHSYRSFCKVKSELRCCQAKSKKVVWTDELQQQLIETKGLTTKEAYELFCCMYGADRISRNGYAKQRSRMGISVPSPNRGNGRRVYQIGDERENCGYTQVKTEAGWISKLRFIYEAAHPEEKTCKGDQFYFANSKREYTLENIIKVSANERTLFMQEGGPSEDPQLTRIRALKAKLKCKQLDLGEKIGDVVSIGKGGRRWRRVKDAKKIPTNQS